MPMCQSPRIADVQLRAKSLPANDNDRFLETGRTSEQPKSTFKTAWPTLVVFLSVGMLIFF
jgi:hypothetical protein